MRSSRYAQLEQLPLSTLVGSVTWIGPSSYSRLILDLHAMSPMVQRDRRFNATRRQVLVSGRDVVWQGKHALQHAFHAAKASLLICPDADCVRTANARELGLAKLVVICNTIAVSECGGCIGGLAREAPQRATKRVSPRWAWPAPQGGCGETPDRASAHPRCAEAAARWGMAG